MITETQLIAHGWIFDDDDGEDFEGYISPGGLVFLDINEDENRCELCIFRECVDEEGELGFEGAVEIFKPIDMTIEELMTFTNFIEEQI